MGEYAYLLYIAIILFSTKILGVFSRKLHMPQVVGALLAGIILGPSVTNLITLQGDVGQFLEDTAEIGVIFLMFSAGLDTDVRELKKNSISAFVVAGIGVLVPVLGGFATYAAIFKPSLANQQELLKAIFIGVVLSATSVSITVETLREMGKLGGKVGTTILGAAVIDDILGIIVLTVVTSLQDTSVKISTVLLKIVLYFVFIGAVFFVCYKCRKQIERFDKRRSVAIMAVVFCLVLSFISEAAFGIADITGAYFAGLILCELKLQPYVNRKTEILSYMFFSPIFFASIGLKTSLSAMSGVILTFSAVLLLVAILSKVLGCCLGARLCGFSGKDALQIGVGMISRGEVALIVAQKGSQCGLLNSNLFGAIVLVVIVTTLITPVLLKMVMRDASNEVNLGKIGKNAAHN